MTELDGILSRASAKVPYECFTLPIDGGIPVWRERVYCYELYHQMRCLWPDSCPYSLNGEVDKGGHPILRQRNAARYKPDFLVHIPGNMAGNHAVIEVKACNARTDAIRKDLKTLNVFTTRVEYHRGIYLIYGGDCSAVLDEISRELTEMPHNEQIEVWSHEWAGGPATRRI